MKNKLFLLCGPRAVGGTYLIESATKEYPELFQEVRSATTRAPRPNQQNEHTRYNFVSKVNFHALIKNRAFVEWDIYRNEYYGTCLQDINDVLACHHALMKITPKGAFALKNALDTFLNMYVVFLIPRNNDVLLGNINRREMTAKSSAELAPELQKAGDFVSEMKKTVAPDDTIYMTGTAMDYVNFKNCLRKAGIKIL